MEVITIEAEAFKKIVKQLEVITTFIEENLEAKSNSLSGDMEESYVSSEDLRNFLGVSERTMQRIRTERLVPFSKVRGRAFYKVKDIRTMMENQIIRTRNANIDDLITKIRDNAL